MCEECGCQDGAPNRHVTVSEWLKVRKEMEDVSGMHEEEAK